jgi:predicted outer membrane protein
MKPRSLSVSYNISLILALLQLVIPLSLAAPPGSDYSKNPNPGLGASSQLGSPEHGTTSSAVKKTEFLSQLHDMHQKTIRIADFGGRKSSSAEVQNYVGKALENLSKAEQEVAKIAKSENIQLKDVNYKANGMKTFKDLQNLKGQEFDRRFLEAVMTLQQDELNFLKNHQNEFADSKMKTLISNLTTLLQQDQNVATNATGEKKQSG